MITLNTIYTTYLLDVLDLLLACLLLYYLYRLLKNTVVIPIFIGVAIIFLIHQLTTFLGLSILTKLLGFVINGGAIAVLIIFQPELRRFLLRLGSVNVSSFRLLKQFRFASKKNEVSFYESDEFSSCMNTIRKFAREKTGALVIWERNQYLDDLIKPENTLNVCVSGLLLESIFFKNAPLHDGAVILRDGQIRAAMVVLPLSENTLPPRLGTRHRAAVGVSEHYDCVAIVISEETGLIHIAMDGQIDRVASKDIEKRMMTILKEA